MLFLEVDWVIVEILYSAMPSRPSVVTIFQGRGMSWWKSPTFISCVGLKKLDGSELEILVSDVHLVISKSP